MVHCFRCFDIWIARKTYHTKENDLNVAEKLCQNDSSNVVTYESYNL